MTRSEHTYPGDVRELYERFPYPLPTSAAEPIFDTAIGVDLAFHDLDGRRVLDAGCGTGHRLVALALQFPDTSFLGLDFSSRSISVAEELAGRYGCANVEFVRAEIGGTPLGRRFDVITSTGVIHHLPDPAAGVTWLAGHLEPDGAMYTWFYHLYGEYDRLLERRLIRLLADTDGDVGRLLGDLKLSLSMVRYGSDTSHSAVDDEAHLAATADAYLHPIVNAYEFDAVPGLFAEQFPWAVVTGVNWPDGSGTINVADWSDTGFGVITAERLFAEPGTRAAFLALDPRAQLHCLELALRPTGFSVVCGRGASLGWCTTRIQQSVALANLCRRGGA
ncbi:class I SAM-dependent methyltransferase [Nonomuraea sp. NBC_01738]|uniref:class I SAM-dependent methyltransferase n=1 Tax=Nonomuraea sp. NBC_01738 TaxID=2976003 RepID=UPI002E0D7FDD|nr:class I SAM-dependent methyltransferase [Nonomuraea sp. NBC_01738]